MPLLQIESLSKTFGSTVALRKVSFALDPGRIVGLVGENGAGKSTLIKLLSGVHQPDQGTVTWLGESVTFPSPVDALNAGIATIHQELACFENLTVAENLLLGEPWPHHRWGGTDWSQLNSEAARRLSECGLQLAPETLFHKLSAAQRQEVAIARALARNARLLILDEPTASLTEPEVVRLMSQLQRLKQNGVAVLYVSHRLDEILSLTDSVLVLRDGQLVAQYSTSEASIERLIRDMVGRDIAGHSRRDSVPAGGVIFRADSLTRKGLFEDISFTVREGEVLGLSGLIGAGRSEIARAIFGLYPTDSGSMELDGQDFAPRHPTEARNAGVNYVPEERKRQGFALDHSLKFGISIGILKRIAAYGLVSARREEECVANAVQRFQIKVGSMEQPVATLSGGNQQKALLARALEADPRLIILDEPTRGVDVGAKAEIHKLIDSLAQQGKAVLLISSDLPEILALSHRILVLHRRRIVAELTAEEATQERILLHASGLKP